MQVAIVTKTKIHYYLFLILTLAREAMNIEIVKKLLNEIEIDLILKDFTKAKIAFINANYISSVVKEFKFPKANDKSEKKVYQQLDEWDLLF